MGQITVQPGDNIQALVTANPAGTVFLIRGEHHGQSVVPKDDMQFIGEQGAVLKGDGAEFAFGGTPGGSGAKRVTLDSLTIQGYVPKAHPPQIEKDFQGPVIRPFGYSYDWVLRRLIVQDNRHRGIQVDNGWRVIDCIVRRNGCLGIGGAGNSATLIDGCEISGNNTEGHDSHNEGGGIKLVHSDGLTVRDCDVFENDGPGVWYDGHSDNGKILGNRVRDNRGPGIDWEINGAALIEGNLCERNGLDPAWADDWDLGGGGIIVIDSAGVIVRNNILLDNQGGIGLMDDARGDRGSWPNLENITVEGNRIRYTARKHGVAIASGRPALSTSVVFDNNRYEVDPNRQGFRVGSTNLSLAGWQAKYPTDLLYEEPVEPPPPLVRPAKPVIFGVERSILWQPVPDADWYRVQVMTDEGWLTFADTVQHEITVGSRGRYRLRAVNGAGGSAWTTLLV